MHFSLYHICHVSVPFSIFFERSTKTTAVSYILFVVATLTEWFTVSRLLSPAVNLSVKAVNKAKQM